MCGFVGEVLWLSGDGKQVPQVGPRYV
jgi:hypothetical protein